MQGVHGCNPTERKNAWVPYIIETPKKKTKNTQTKQVVHVHGKLRQQKITKGYPDKRTCCYTIAKPTPMPLPTQKGYSHT